MDKRFSISGAMLPVAAPRLGFVGQPLPAGRGHKQLFFDTAGMPVHGVLVAYQNPRPAHD